MLASLFGEPLTSLAYTARRLREQQPPMWLHPGSGVRRVTLTVEPMVNLMLAAGVRNPIRAPEIVRRLRDLRIEDDQHREHFGGSLPGGQIVRGGVVIAETFGATLEAILESFVQHVRGTRPLPPLVSVEIRPEGTLPEAIITVADSDGPHHYRFWAIDLLTEAERKGLTQQAPVTITRPVLFWQPLFIRVAEIIAASSAGETLAPETTTDNQSPRGTSHSEPAPTSAEQNETEADGAPPPKASAHGQSASKQTVLGDTEQSNERGKKGQPLPGSRPGRSLNQGGRCHDVAFSSAVAA
jgi:hypothetical protein